ncbi:MAG: hypothetical protein DYG89_31195 [Caldilinea sp. CFX5]|nr:hypothetical protein [Caldilinea sp. CFX5]
MIVVDENIQDDLVIRTIASWYPGQVISVTALRLQTLIKDDGIAMLLHQASESTFVTTNVDDFWPKFPAHRRYCIVSILLTIEETMQVPETLRNLLRLPEFRTKAARMGKVIRVRPSGIEYALDRRIHFLPWPT